MVAMLDCKQVRAELSNYLDGEVSAEVKAAIDDHLSRCRCCAVMFDTTRKTLTIVTEANVFTVPVEMSKRLHDKLQEAYAAP